MALPPGALDEVIGDEPRAHADVFKSIVNSKQFKDAVKEAVENSHKEPMTRWGQTVREKLINLMRGDDVNANERRPPSPQR